MSAPSRSHWYDAHEVLSSVSPRCVIRGSGKGFTSSCRRNVSSQPSVVVTRTQYAPDAETVMLVAVDPVDHS
ncbi:MAG: hypothetical protein IPP94_15355 [Ignavibacteria bacterium]|nr:hypothetical protein [Ignavibacteria bacterium]